MGNNLIKERIRYIDSLKGLSMLMVVCGHIIIFCSLNHENEFVRHIVLINMPLFFFLNGLVIKKIENREGNKWITAVKRKTLSLLIPFFAWGALITLFRNATYYEFLSNYFKFGYWYLPVLFQCYVIYWLCELLLRYIPKKHIQIETIALYAFAYLALRFITKYIPPHINAIVDYFQLIEYLPFFFLGLLVKRGNVTERVMKNSSVWTTSMLVFTFAGYLWWDHYTGELSTFILRACLILLIYILFVIYNRYTNKYMENINQTLALIGRHTLGIYMIQFFLFRYIELHSIGTYLFESHNIIAFIILVTAVSLAVCYICIAIEKVITASRLFSFILLGKPMSKALHI